jgi:hypothetical protein
MRTPLVGVLSGSIALVALEVLLTSKQPGRIAQLFALPAAWARYLVDPAIPGIPNRAKAAVPAPATPPLPGAPSLTLPPRTI